MEKAKFKFEFRIRDRYEKITYMAEEKADDVDTAILRVRERTIGWGNCFVLDAVREDKDGNRSSYIRPPQFSDYDRKGNKVNKEVR